MITSKVGIEVEYLLFNAKGDVIVPPASWDRDGFPLLGEIRGKEGKNMPEVLGNFGHAQYEVVNRLRDGATFRSENRFRVPLKIYREANKQVDGKPKEIGKVKNIYGVDIEDFSDQIVEKGKIQGIWVSCGLHIHFSCEDYAEREVKIPKYEEVILPLSIMSGEKTAWNTSAYLFRKEGYDVKEKFFVRASKLNKPTITWLVEQMDRTFFERFAPAEKERTKYRQPGFYEIKPYGFEYRSLPANQATLAALPEIVTKAFELLTEADS
jgi:hypothetical protein